MRMSQPAAVAGPQTALAPALLREFRKADYDAVVRVWSRGKNGVADFYRKRGYALEELLIMTKPLSSGLNA